MKHWKNTVTPKAEQTRKEGISLLDTEFPPSAVFISLIQSQTIVSFEKTLGVKQC